jgi:T-complex protein 1 subunit zeta
MQEISQNAEIVSKQQALQVNVAAATGPANVLKSNLGPTGTLKLLVGGAGQLTLTKDGLTYLTQRHANSASHSAALIARTATAVDDIAGDGSTLTVLLTGELLKQAAVYAQEGLHARVVTGGFDRARDAALEFLKGFAVSLDIGIMYILIHLCQNRYYYFILRSKTPVSSSFPGIFTCKNADRCLHETGTNLWD